MKTLLPVLCILSMLTLACSKNEVEPDVPNPVEISTVDLLLSFKPAAPLTTVFELIVSQQNGHVLLDTLLEASKQHQLKLRTDDKVFNVSTVTNNTTLQGGNQFIINSFFGINPNKWVINENLNYSQNSYHEESTLNSKIRYTNLPANYGGFAFYTTKLESYFSGLSSQSKDIQINSYSRVLPDNQTYLFLPDLGKYIFSKANASEMSIDYSTAGDLKAHNFNKPIGFTLTYVNLNGYLSSSSHLNPLQVFNSVKVKTMLSLINPIVHDLHYPPTLFQNFELNLNFKNADNDELKYYRLGNAIPDDLSFLKKPDFTISTTNPESIAISTGQSVPTSYKLGFYTTDRNTFNALWKVTLPQDVKSFDVKLYKQVLSKSHLLKDRNLALLNFNSVEWTKAPGYTHQSFLDYLFNPEAMRMKELKEHQQYTKYF